MPFANLLPFYGSCNSFYVGHELKIRYQEEELVAKFYQYQVQGIRK